MYPRRSSAYSDDSTMAYVVVDKLVILRQNLTTNKMEQTHLFALGIDI